MVTDSNYTKLQKAMIRYFKCYPGHEKNSALDVLICLRNRLRDMGKDNLAKQVKPHEFDES